MNINDIKIDKTTEVKESKVVEPTKDSKKIERDKKGRLKKGSILNPTGKGGDGISLLADIKKKLLEVKNDEPNKYKELIDYYWKNEKTRDLLIKMIDGNPKTIIAGDQDNPVVITGINIINPEDGTKSKTNNKTE